MLFDCLKHASRDFGETQQFLANKGLESRLPGRGAADIDRRFDAIIRSTYGQNLYVAYMEYGADIEIDAAAERMDYGFSIPVGGTMASSAGDGEILGCTRTQTVLASPGQPQTMYLAGDAKRLALSVQQDLVRQRLAALTGEDVHGVIEFEPILDVTAGAGHLITSNMEMIVASRTAACRCLPTVCARRILRRPSSPHCCSTTATAIPGCWSARPMPLPAGT